MCSPPWPATQEAGTSSDGDRTYEPRRPPSTFTIVMIQPTVVVMSYDLGALAGAVPPPAHGLRNPHIDAWIHYGSEISASGSLSWFSQDVGQEPTPVRMQSEDRGEIWSEKP